MRGLMALLTEGYQVFEPMGGQASCMVDMQRFLPTTVDPPEPISEFHP
jgi:hypothetical protein